MRRTILKEGRGSRRAGAPWTSSTGDARRAVACALAVVVVLSALAACARRPRVLPPAPPPTAPVTRSVRVQVDGRVAATAIEDYVAGCVVAELGSMPLDARAAARARDVQAILCRSYALGNVGRHAAEGFDVCSTTHCQVYRPVPATAIGRLSRESAQRTAGLVLKVGERRVVPVYHADCGGRTSGAADVWGGEAVSYLVSVKDDVCPTRPPWRSEIPQERLVAALRGVSNLDAAGLRDIVVEARDSAGRAASIRLSGARTPLIRGNDLRNAIIAALGPSSLPSTLFSVTRRGRTFVFVGRGNGHGVGLCQAGLIARAARGEEPLKILARYFPGTTVAAR